MEKDKQLDLYCKLMMLSLENPNAIFDICVNVIISMCVLNEDSQEEFDKTLEIISQTFKEVGSMSPILMGFIFEKP